jgi:glycosyltransferase involved in cell wall biosynthesis
LPYLVTYHTPTFSCGRGTLLRWGSEVCDGVIRPRRCAECRLHGQGWPRPLAGLLALSPLSWDRLPDGPWLSRVALRSLTDAGLAGWREFMTNAAGLVACADWCRDVLVANGVPAERIGVHRQALPGPDRTRRLRLPLPERRPLRLGFFGRVTWVKGPDLFLAGLRRLRLRGVDVVGELVGPVADSDRAWADRLLASTGGLATYPGVRRDGDLAAWLDSLDLVVVPSRWMETGPLTVLEAWDRGVPVVGANLGGIPDFLRAGGQHALLFPPEDADGLADAVLRAAAWPDRNPEVPIGGMVGLGRWMEDLYREAGRAAGRHDLAGARRAF